MSREQPSRHGALLGEMLSALEQAGRREAGVPLPDMCATCAFLPGSMTSQMAATGIEAMNILAGADKDRFACHHGMKDGQPQKLCAGYIAASLAPFSYVKAGVEWLDARLAETADQPDEVRAAYQIWLAHEDPAGLLNDYQLARLYAKRGPVQPSTGAKGEGGL